MNINTFFSFYVPDTSLHVAVFFPRTSSRWPKEALFINIESSEESFNHVGDSVLAAFVYVFFLGCCLGVFNTCKCYEPCEDKKVHVYVILVTEPAIIVSCERKENMHVCWKECARATSTKIPSLVSSPPAPVNTVPWNCLLDIQGLKCTHLSMNEWFL